MLGTEQPAFQGFYAVFRWRLVTEVDKETVKTVFFEFVARLENGNRAIGNNRCDSVAAMARKLQVGVVGEFVGAVQPDWHTRMKQLGVKIDGHNSAGIGERKERFEVDFLRVTKN